MNIDTIKYLSFLSLLVSAQSSWAEQPIAVGIKRLSLDTALSKYNLIRKQLTTEKDYGFE